MKNQNKVSNLIDALLDDILPVVPYVGQWVLDFTVDMGVALIHPISLFVRGKSDQSWIEIAFELVITLARYPLQLMLTVGSLFLNTIASLINHKISRYHERVLNTDEKTYLKSIFGNSVNYDVVRIQFGGMKESLFISPQAVGNDIFIREVWGARMVFPDRTLTADGLRLLGHEVAHVWQYQHFGAGYIGDSLMTQVLDVVGRKFGIHLSDGYDLCSALKDKRDVQTCNVEQQAVMAELIGVACREDQTGALTLQSFNRVSGFNLTEKEFASAKAAHTWYGETC